jgi:hypothetical protein
MSRGGQVLNPDLLVCSCESGQTKGEQIILSPRGEDRGEGAIPRQHPHPSPLPPRREREMSVISILGRLLKTKPFSHPVIASTSKVRGNLTLKGEILKGEMALVPSPSQWLNRSLTSIDFLLFD